MIYLVTGTTGAKKTAYVVSILDKIEIDNKVNITKNPSIYQNNLDILAKHDLLSELSYYIDEQGSGDTYHQEIVVLPDDYYHMLGVSDYDLLRPDDYFKRSAHFNKMIGRIHDKHGDIGLSAILPVRTIYTNIEALRIDYVRSLTPDWRDCPDGSLIVIDEVQLVHPYSDIKDRSNPIITQLSVHRHRGFDFYLITQSAGNLHVLIKDLIYTHYHVTIPFGLQTKIYQYGEFKANPNARTVKLTAENAFSFSPSQHIFKLYKSTTINTAKLRLPLRRLFLLASFVALGLCLTIYALSGTKNPATKYDEPAEQAPVQVPVQTQSTPEVPAQGSASSADASELSKEQLEQKLKVQEQQFKLELEKQKLEMIMQYEQLHKQFAEQQKQLQDFYARLEMYKTMLPKNYEIIKNDPNLQVRAVVKMGNKCNAYNAHGDLMNLSPEQCDYYLQETGRVQKGSLSGNGSSPVARLETKPVADILSDNPQSHIQPVQSEPAQSTPDK